MTLSAKTIQTLLTDAFTAKKHEKMITLLLENQQNSITSNLKAIMRDQWRYGGMFTSPLLPGEVRKAYLSCCWCHNMLPDGHASDELYCSSECERLADLEEEDNDNKKH